MADSETKAQIRAELLARRRALPLAERRRASEVIAARFLSLPELRGARVVGLYLSLGDEVDTGPLIASLRQSDPSLLLAAPVIFPARRMEFFPLPLDLETLEPGPHGVRQPPVRGQQPLPRSSLDVLILPGVAFAPDGHRLGYGAGYYDRFLASLVNERREDPTGPPLSAASRLAVRRPLLVGFAYALQLLPTLPAEPHDIPVDIILTERAAVRPTRV